MATKIQSLTIVTQKGVSQYFVGNEYNGLKLHVIMDSTREYPDSFHSVYQGRTSSGDLVFETINAPVEIVYRKIED